MSDYSPDRWLIVKIVTPKERLYKVFASWSGGYGGSDSWKMNSGITRASLVDDRWEFDGYSGSVYSCHKESYGVSGYNGNVLQNFINKATEIDAVIEIMPGDTNWSNLDYDPLQQFITDGVNNV